MRDRKQALKRKRRRSADRLLSIPRTVDRVWATSFHEAGHAVAMYLTSDDRGVDPDNSIDSIVLHPEIMHLQAGKSNVLSLRHIGTCYSGNFLPLDLELEAGWRPDDDTDPDLVPPEYRDAYMKSQREYNYHWTQALRLMSKQTLDRWLLSEFIVFVAGAMAEATFWRTFRIIWNRGGCSHDQHLVLKYGDYANKSIKEICEFERNAIKRCRKLFSHPAVRIAISAVAFKVIQNGIGETPGDRIIKIIKKYANMPTMTTATKTIKLLDCPEVRILRDEWFEEKRKAELAAPAHVREARQLRRMAGLKSD